MNMGRTRTFTTALSAILLVALLAIQWLPQWYHPSRAFAQQEANDQNLTRRSVSVTGSAQVRVQLDLAIVRVGVQTSGSEAVAALESNNEQMQALLDALENAGVAEDDIQTQTIQLQPQYANAPQEFPSEPVAPAQSETMSDTTSSVPEITGYIAINTVEVRTSDLANLGGLLDEIVAAGGNQIAGIRFDVTNANEALATARDAAWQDARQKAEQLAELSGIELGEVLTISEFSRGPVPMAEASLAARDVTAVPVQPGTQDVGVDLQVTWQLQ